MCELILKNSLRKKFITEIKHYKQGEIIHLDKSSQSKVASNTIEKKINTLFLDLRLLIKETSNSFDVHFGFSDCCISFAINQIYRSSVFLFFEPF
jgi:hypothetical protein